MSRQTKLKSARSRRDQIETWLQVAPQEYAKDFAQAELAVQRLERKAKRDAASRELRKKILPISIPPSSKPGMIIDVGPGEHFPGQPFGYLDLASSKPAQPVQPLQNFQYKEPTRWFARTLMILVGVVIALGASWAIVYWLP